MPFQILDHTAEAKMRVTAPTREGLFGEALRGMMAMLAPEGWRWEARTARPVAAKAADITVLLVDFLNEALALSAMHKEIYREIALRSFSETALEGELHGAPAS